MKPEEVKMDPAQGQDVPGQVFRDSFRSLQLEMRGSALGMEISGIYFLAIKVLGTGLVILIELVRYERYKTLPF